MTETRKRIKELKDALPRARERIVAVAVLLAMSVTMMATVSYAWYTMSTAPEIGSIRTTVSSNGSLEVALAGRYDEDGNLLAPSTSGTGDSFSAEGQTTVGANVTWGNLINLSGSYGIENLVLRPASYSDTAAAFLNSKIYGEDGRVEGNTADFDFTYWMEVGEENKYWTFAYSPMSRYGVRAISSVTYPDGKGETEAMISKLSVMHGDVADAYESIYKNDVYIGTINDVVQLYLDGTIDEKLNNGDLNKFDFSNQVTNLYLMLKNFNDNVVVPYGDVLAYMVNIQLGTTKYNSSNMYDGVKEGAVVQELATYKTLVEDIDEALDNLKTYSDIAEDGGKVTWANISKSANTMIGIDDAEIEIDGQGYKISDLSTMGLGDLASLVLGMPESPKQIPITLYSGAFHTFESLCGDKYMSVVIDFKIDATVEVKGIPVPVKKNCRGNIRTDARNAKAVYATDYDYTVDNAGEFKSTNKIAADTYGLVIDLWVRTNAANSVLTLDGLAQYEEYEIHIEDKANIPDSEGNVTTVSKKVWYYTVNEVKYNVYEDRIIDADDLNDNGNTEEEIVVYKAFNDNQVAYIEETTKDEATGEETTSRRLVAAADVKKAVRVEHNVTGFQSSNRIEEDYDTYWDDAGYASATQGSGSCYIFYAENPEKADGVLKLLKNLKMTFVNESGTELAYAEMQVDYAYQDGAKYIVPIIIVKTDVTFDVLDEKGNVINEDVKGITELVQNEPTLISVVVYLDGEGLDNSMVFSNDSVVGNLNLQFASSADLESLKNEDLSNQYISLSATIEDGLEKNLTYTGEEQKLTLAAQIQGVIPNTAHAAFYRQINSTQGSVQERVELKYNEATAMYECEYPFKLPGTYVLSSIWVDGVEYDLGSKLTVTVDGFTVDQISMDGDSNAYTADDSTTRVMRVKFAAMQDPGSVYVKFLSENENYTTGKLTLSENGEWTGDVKFTESGKHTLTYLVLDGEYYSVAPDKQIQLTVQLGLYAEVTLEYTYEVKDEEGNITTVTSEYTKRDLNFKYAKPVSVKVMASVYSNTDEEMTNLGKISLVYLNEKYAGEEFGLDAKDMSWDGTYYTGTFQVKSAGVYHFAYVKIGSEFIRRATQAPSVKATYPDPPSYSGTQTQEVIVNESGNTAYYEAMIAYGPSMTDTYAIFQNAAGDQKVVAATGLTGNVYSFPFPYYDTTNASPSNQNGVWKVVGFYFNNVYEGEKHYYKDPDTGEGEYYRVVLAEPETYYVYDEIVLRSITAGNLSGVFMEELNASNGGISVTLSMDNIPFKGDDAKVKITDVQITLVHNSSTSSAHGGYTFTTSDSTKGMERRTLRMEDPDGNDVWTVASGTVFLAGTYNYELQVTLSDGTFYTCNSQKKEIKDANKRLDDVLLTVESAAPTVKITDISLDGNGAYSVDLNASGSLADTSTKKEISNGCIKDYQYTCTTHANHIYASNNTEYISRIENSGKTAWLYFKCNHKDVKTYDGGTKNGDRGATYEGHTYSYNGGEGVPKATLTLRGMGQATSAVLEFEKTGGGDVIMITKYTADSWGGTYWGDYSRYGTTSYSWTADGDCYRFIGVMDNGAGDNGSDTKTAAGTIVGKTLVLVYEGVEFSVPVSITIHNPC